MKYSPVVFSRYIRWRSYRARHITCCRCVVCVCDRVQVYFSVLRGLTVCQRWIFAMALRTIHGIVYIRNRHWLQCQVPCCWSNLRGLQEGLDCTDRENREEQPTRWHHTTTDNWCINDIKVMVRFRGGLLESKTSVNQGQRLSVMFSSNEVYILEMLAQLVTSPWLSNSLDVHILIQVVFVASSSLLFSWVLSIYFIITYIFSSNIMSAFHIRPAFVHSSTTPKKLISTACAWFSCLLVNSVK